MRSDIPAPLSGLRVTAKGWRRAAGRGVDNGFRVRIY
jgi:hypothetical protein